jgi:hypothetical protein
MLILSRLSFFKKIFFLCLLVVSLFSVSQAQQTPGNWVASFGTEKDDSCYSLCATQDNGYALLMSKEGWATVLCQPGSLLQILHS